MDKWSALYKYLWETKQELEMMIDEDKKAGVHTEFTDMMSVHIFALIDVIFKMDELEKHDACEFCKHRYKLENERPCSLCEHNFDDNFEEDEDVS